MPGRGVSSSFRLGNETAERRRVLDSVSHRMSDTEVLLLLLRSPVSREPGGRSQSAVRV